MSSGLRFPSPRGPDQRTRVQGRWSPAPAPGPGLHSGPGAQWSPLSIELQPWGQAQSGGAGPSPGPMAPRETVGCPWLVCSTKPGQPASAGAPSPASALSCSPPPRPCCRPTTGPPSPARRTLWPLLPVGRGRSPSFLAGPPPQVLQAPPTICAGPPGSQVGVGVGWEHGPRPPMEGCTSYSPNPNLPGSDQAGAVGWLGGLGLAQGPGRWSGAAPVPKFTPWSVSTGTDASP